MWDSSLRPPLFTQEAGASQPWGLGLETQAAAGPSQAAAEVPPGPSPVQAEAGVQVDPAELQAYLSGPGRRARGLAAAQRFHAPVAPGAPDVVTLERGGEHATRIRPGPGPRPALPPSILAARRKIAEVAGDLDPEVKGFRGGGAVHSWRWGRACLSVEGHTQASSTLAQSFSVQPPAVKWPPD